MLRLRQRGLPRGELLAQSRRGDMVEDPSSDSDSNESIVFDPSSNNLDSSSHAYSNKKHDDAKEIREMVRKESKNVNVWREIVTGMLVIVSILTTVSTYIFLSRQEVDEFRDSFQEAAATIADRTQFGFEALTESMEAVADLLTAYAVGESSVPGTSAWPFVTMDRIGFEKHASHVQCLASTDIVVLTPIVTSFTHGLWELYTRDSTVYGDVPFSTEIFGHNGTAKIPVDPVGPYTPVHQIHPGPPKLLESLQTSMVNLDMSSEDLESTYNATNVLSGAALSGLRNLTLFRESFEGFDIEEPLTVLVAPIFRSLKDSFVEAYLHTVLEWQYLFSDVYRGTRFTEASAVVESPCIESFTYLIHTNDTAVFLGFGDLHEEQYNGQEKIFSLSPHNSPDRAEAAGACAYTVTLYPTLAMREKYKSGNSTVYTIVIGAVFFWMALTFLLYDNFVKRRNDKITRAAIRSNAIVSSLFPAAVRERLYKEKAEEEAEAKKKRDRWLPSGNGLSVRKFEAEEDKARPLADLFPSTTIMFADIAGFTAWSSVREPSQVFSLLETLYQAFDTVAKRRRIFKVETIGDCYVAVAGLPEPRQDHAVAMAKFANDIMRKTHHLTRKLEVTLGPDTGDLTLRVGLHSGQVTAGVLRGEKSRFQLFGDTMNTASRMESNGMRGKIQLSQETADLLIAAGKAHWLKPREDKIKAKGKGELSTFWLDMRVGSEGSTTRSHSSDQTDSCIDDVVNGVLDTVQEEKEQQRSALRVRRALSDKTHRLINWNVDVLLRLLQTIVARRGPCAVAEWSVPELDTHRNPFDEVKEIIQLPEFDPTVVRHHVSPDEVVIPDNVVEQLRDYVTNIALLYNSNAFHNFEHCSHVAMSVSKLLSRIVAPRELLDQSNGLSRGDLGSTLHDHTYGITSDPLTQFSCVFSAIIHDVQHSGVPNTRLIDEDKQLASRYQSKSVAEQNSIDVSLDLLQTEAYRDLLGTICGDLAEYQRFRQLVVNSVMATDIMDKQLKELRNARWDQAFDGHIDQNEQDTINRKATIVIEHLIQASDVSHTMQHWHVYCRWNQRFFEECYFAYLQGRADKDPSENWYKGELGFFDFYIIPLAKKLKDCGVFGVSSDEYLNYALMNRSEFESRGQELVAEMVEHMQEKVRNRSARQLVRRNSLLGNRER